MAKPISEQMAALFVVRPVGENGFRRHDSVYQKQGRQGRTDPRAQENDRGKSSQPDAEQRRASHQRVVAGFQIEQRSPAEQRFLVRLKNDRGGVDGDRRYHRAATPAEHAVARVLGGHHRADQGHPVADAKGNHHVRGREEDPAHLLALTVRRRIQQHDQQHRQAHIHGHQSGEPGLLPFLHSGKEEKRDQSDEQVSEVEFIHRAGQQHPHLIHETAQAAGGIGALILAARQRVKKTLPGPRVAPVQWRIGHRGRRHVKIKGRAQHPKPSQRDPREGHRPVRLCPHEKPAGNHNENAANQIVSDESGQALVEPGCLADSGAEQRQDIKGRRAKNDFPPLRQRIGGGALLAQEGGTGKGRQRRETGQVRHGQEGRPRFADVNQPGHNPHEQSQVTHRRAQQKVAPEGDPILESLHGHRGHPDPGRH